MNRTISANINRIIPLAVAILLMAAGSVYAQVNLSWSPADTTRILPAGTSRLSIYVDEVINFRTVEVTVTYDTTVIKSLGGGTGSLFSGSGFFIVDGFEEEPGSWHGFAVVMGAGDYVTGPGELLFWDIEGLAEGTSSVISVETLLYDEASPPVLIPDVTLDTATVIVHDPLSAVQEIPNAGRRLRVAPNPFNPRTRISFDVPVETYARLSVFDMRGYQIALLHDGPTAAGIFSEDWNGTDDSGKSQPGGVYLFQLETREGVAQAKGILVK